MSTSWLARPLGRRSLLGAGLAAPLVACSSSNGQHTSVSNPQTGIAIPFHVLDALSDGQLDQRLAWLAQVGVLWLRFDFYWFAMEPEQGKLKWSGADRIVTAARKHGLSLLGVIQTMPSWARSSSGDPHTTGPTTEAQRAAYADFAGACASRYGGRVDCWEVWNEPNLVAFWSPRPAAGDYIALLKSTHTAIKRANPKATVVTGGLGGAAASNRDVPADTFVRAMLAAGSAGAIGHFDAFADHPYTNKQSGEVDGRLSGQPRLRARLDRAGLQDIPLWGTETGAPTTGGSGAHLGDDVSQAEERQAALWTATYAFWRSIHTTGPLFWYTLLDVSDSSTDDSSNHFGMFRLDGSAKPLADVVAKGV